MITTKRPFKTNKKCNKKTNKELAFFEERNKTVLEYNVAA